MYTLSYHRPTSLAEAKAMFAEGLDATFLSGGHTLLPTLKQRLAAPTDLVDLTRIPEMKGIVREGDILKIGAASTHSEVYESDVVRGAIPVLARLAGSIADRHVRHRGTLGGSVANNDPAADYPSAVLALNATVVTDRREIAADDFFTGLYATAREPGEIVTRIDVPIPDLAAYAKFKSSASRYSIAGVFVARTGGHVRVAITGAGANGVFRATAFEDALDRDFRPEALDTLSLDPGDMLGDLNGTGEYRAHLAHVLCRRAVSRPGEVQAYK